MPIRPEDIANQYEKVAKNQQEIQDQLRDYTAKVESELQRTNDLSSETKNKVDELMAHKGKLDTHLREIDQVLASLKELKDNGKHTPQNIKEVALSNKAFMEQMKNMSVKGGGTAILELNNTITSIIDGGKNIVETQRLGGIITPAQQKLTVRDLLNWGTTRSNAIEYLRESGFDNQADFVRENPTKVKPESDVSFELKSANIETIAHWLPATKQVMDDVQMLGSYLGGRLLDGLKLKEEQALIYGTGDGVTIKGINTQASPFASTTFADLLDTNATSIDKLRVAILQAELAEHDTDGILLNPEDWVKIELTKDKNGNYLFGNPHSITAPLLWSRRVVATKTITKNNFLLGSFAMGAMGWDKEQANIRVSTEDRDNFVKNMVTILCEARLGLTVFRPEAFVKGTLDV